MVEATTRGQPRGCEQCGCQPSNAQATNDRIAGHGQSLAEQLPNRSLQGNGFAKLTVGQCGKIMEVKRGQSLLKYLPLA